jgi:outer membrane lipoprotein-sorting protein
MKKIIFSSIVVFALLAMAFTTIDESEKSPEQNLTAKEIIKKSEQNFRGLSSHAKMKMTIVRPKWERTTTMESWNLGDDYSMTLVTGPARDKGMAFMKRGKEIWNWQPKIDRVIKMPQSMMSQGWMGSDLKNDDLVRESSIVKDYDHKLLKKVKYGTHICYKIEMTPKENAAVVWGKILILIDTKYFLQLKTEFYDEDDYLVNKFLGTNIKEMGGRMITTKMIVKPADEPNNRTILEYEDIQFEVKLKESFFTIQNIKKLR